MALAHYPMDTSVVDVRWSHPFSCILAGPSNSGKSFFVKKMLEHAGRVLTVMPNNIVWCYSCWQPLYKEMLNKYPFITFMDTLPDTFNDERMFPTNKVNLVIVDDLMDSACKSDEIEKAFTKYVHHRNLSIIYIVQNVFCQGKASRTITLNTKYMVLFKNPRDKLQIAILARQMYPGKSKFFLEVFEDATRKPFGYLVVDLNNTTPEAYRLRTDIFPPDWTTVYCEKPQISHKKK